MSISDTQLHGNNLFSGNSHNQDLNSFRPERWAKPDLLNGTPKSKPCYLPFGIGSRLCVGKWYALLFLKTLTVRLLRNYDYELLENNTGDMKMDYLPVHRPSGNLRTVFVRKNVLQL